MKPTGRQLKMLSAKLLTFYITKGSFVYSLYKLPAMEFQDSPSLYKAVIAEN